MISPKTLVRLGLSARAGCPQEWSHVVRNHRCRATGDAHLCVGDAGHGGKHVCPCGSTRRVGL